MTNASIKRAHPSDKNTNTRTHFQAAESEELRVTDSGQIVFIYLFIFNYDVIFKKAIK